MVQEKRFHPNCADMSLVRSSNSIDHMRNYFVLNRLKSIVANYNSALNAVRESLEPR